MEIKDQVFDSGYNSQQRELWVTAPMRKYLLQMVKWAKFLSIIGFIFVAYFVLKALTFNTFLDSFLSPRSMYEPVGPLKMVYTTSGIIIRTISPLFKATVCFFPFWYLYQFSLNLKLALVKNEYLDLDFAFSKLKSFLKTCAIIAVVLLGYFSLELFFIILNRVVAL